MQPDSTLLGSALTFIGRILPILEDPTSSLTLDPPPSVPIAFSHTKSITLECYFSGGIAYVKPNGSLQCKYVFSSRGPSCAGWGRRGEGFGGRGGRPRN